MRKEATFGAGCFWCIEACFQDIHGVLEVYPGYSGGDGSTANYKAVCTGKTGHAEVARVVFDSEEVSYQKLLEMFWFVHDPTQLNRQGNDIGAQYRSVIFYHDDEQRALAEESKRLLSDSGAWERPIVTEVSPLQEFYRAEQYHHNYLALNPDNPYCQNVVRPKVEKFKRAFDLLLK